MNYLILMLHVFVSGGLGHRQKYFVMMLNFFVMRGPWAELFCNDVTCFHTNWAMDKSIF